MNQSDSPDFEFDISNLEVEGENAPASEKGEPTPKPESPRPASGPADELGGSTIGKFEDDGDEELKGFAIDEMPDVSEPASAKPGPQSEADAPPVEAAPEADTESDSASNPVTRIEPEKEHRPSRTMGEDDLGADVFAEMESNPSMMSLDDVIDDLMEEVEEFEAGGFVELDEEDAKSQSAEDDGLFKLDDPDDSLVHSVDPNAVVAEPEPTEAAPSFPAPPANFEIPADLDREEQPQSEAAPEAPEIAQPSPARPQSDAASRPTPSPAKNAPQPTTKQIPDFSDFEIPADPEPAVASERPKEGSSIPAEDPIMDPEATETISPEKSESVSEEAPVSSGDGFEKVFFDAAEEAASESANVEKIPEKDSAEIAETDEFTDSEEIPVSATPADAESDEAETSPVAEANEGEEAEPVSVDEPETAGEEEPISELPPAAEEAPVETSSENVTDEDSDEDDLSALLDAISEEETEEVENVSEVPVETESTEVEPVSESEAEADSETVSSEEAEDQAEPSAEEEELLESVDLDEVEEDDLSELIDAAISEEATSEVEEQEEVTADDIAANEPDSESSEEPVSQDDAETPEEAESEEPASASAPELSILDDDEEDAVESLEDESSEALSESEPEALETEAAEEIPEDGEEAVDEDSEGESMPALSADDLLKQAGSLLAVQDGQKPIDGANELLNNLVVEDDEEETVAMPDPVSMIEEAAGADDEDDEVIAMPDPAVLLANIEEESEEAEKVEEVKSGNIADRAGDLPPPPPAPVEIIDEEPPEEDFQAVSEEEASEDEFDSIAGLVEVSEESPEIEENTEEEGPEDPFAKEISLEDFDENLDGLDGLDSEDAEAMLELSAEEAAALAKEKTEQANKVIEMPKPSLLWRVTHSLSIAAGLVLIGLASVLAVWKQQIVEFIEGRDLDGSALIAEIKEIGTHALSDLDQNGLYRMKWVDSEVRRVSENEIRLGALVGAQLQENLYRPVLESELDESMRIDEGALLESLALAHDQYPEEISRFPEKPWKTLYQITANKEEIVPLKVTYGLTRASEDDDWELTKVKVAGYREELKWPEGQPRYAFGENAYDVESEEFAKVLASYKKDANGFVATIAKHQSDEAAARLAKKQAIERQRDRVRLALAEGTYFDGVAIIGEDASESRDIQLVITEVRGEGAFIKGVVKMGASGEKTSKHFVGNLDFEETLGGQEQGFLNLTTVSVDLPETPKLESAFFEPRTVSRMRLRADGFRLEGDSCDLSLRLTRSF